MQKDLNERIDSLRTEIANADEDARSDLIDHLEQAVLGLESIGHEAPAWAREVLQARQEEEAEIGFDNMPV
jgi:hypothetical protein